MLYICIKQGIGNRKWHIPINNIPINIMQVNAWLPCGITLWHRITLYALNNASLLCSWPSTGYIYRNIFETWVCFPHMQQTRKNQIKSCYTYQKLAYFVPPHFWLSPFNSRWLEYIHVEYFLGCLKHVKAISHLRFN